MKTEQKTNHAAVDLLQDNGTNARTTPDRVIVGSRMPQQEHSELDGSLMICGMEAGSFDGNDYYKDSGATEAGWSQDARWEEAARLREVARVYEQGAADHADEACAAGVGGRPYTTLDEASAAVQDKMKAQEYLTQANQLENQIAQDASKGAENDGGCTIC